MNQQINSHKHQIEKLEGEKVAFFKLRPSSIQPAISTNPLEELGKTFPNLNIVKVQVEDLERTIVTSNDEIHVLGEQFKEKKGIISENEENKRK